MAAQPARKSGGGASGAAAAQQHAPAASSQAAGAAGGGAAEPMVIDLLEDDSSAQQRGPAPQQAQAQEQHVDQERQPEAGRPADREEAAAPSRAPGAAAEPAAVAAPGLAHEPAAAAEPAATPEPAAAGAKSGKGPKAAAEAPPVLSADEKAALKAQCEQVRALAMQQPAVCLLLAACQPMTGPVQIAPQMHALTTGLRSPPSRPTIGWTRESAAHIRAPPADGACMNEPARFPISPCVPQEIPLLEQALAERPDLRVPLAAQHAGGGKGGKAAQADLKHEVGAGGAQPNACTCPRACRWASICCWLQPVLFNLLCMHSAHATRLLKPAP